MQNSRMERYSFFLASFFSSTAAVESESGASSTLISAGLVTPPPMARL